MDEYSEEEYEYQGILGIARSKILAPFRVAVSKPALRAYASTILIVLTALVLAGFAIFAYSAFYYAFIPIRGFSRPVYLQFDPAHHPYGIAPLSRSLLSNQPYDVKIILHLPRTPTNRDAGNFMLDLQLLSPPNPGVSGAETRVLAQERRPAIMTYYSPIVEHVIKSVELPWYLLGWRYESETLVVPVMEGVEFAKGWRNVPDTVKLEVLSDVKMQIYSVKVDITAQFRGLRYIMYNYRILSFILFTGTFWAVEMTFAFLGWSLLYLYFFHGSDARPSLPKREKAEPTDKELKTEPGTDTGASGDNLSDTSRQFPTYAGQPPLRYSSPRVKEEKTEEVPRALADIPPAVEADDEDEDVDFVDSGLGTSMESSATVRDSVRRRKSRLFGGSGRTV